MRKKTDIKKLEDRFEELKKLSEKRKLTSEESEEFKNLTREILHYYCPPEALEE